MTKKQKEVEKNLKLKKIAKLNDLFRTTFNGGEIVITQNINQLTTSDKLKLFKEIQNYSILILDNDPYGEHDFGAISFKDQIYIWRIDYYDSKLKYGSNDPSDPKKTTRVLTIMQATT